MEYNIHMKYEISDNMIKKHQIVNEKLKIYIYDYIYTKLNRVNLNLYDYMPKNSNNGLLICCYFNNFKGTLWISNVSYNFIVSPIIFPEVFYELGIVFLGTKDNMYIHINKILLYNNENNIQNNVLMKNIKDIVYFNMYHDYEKNKYIMYEFL